MKILNYINYQKKELAIKTYLKIMSFFPAVPISKEFDEEMSSITEFNGVEKRIELKPDARNLIKVVTTGGKFEILHPGHLHLLEFAKKHGDLLVVVAASDKTIQKTKNRIPIMPQTERIAMLNSLKCVDIAIPGGENKLDTLRAITPDIIVFGYDQKIDFPETALKDIKILRAPKKGDYSTTKVMGF